MHRFHRGGVAAAVVLSGVLGLWSKPADAQPFSFSFVEQSMERIAFGASSWADVDGDADFDVLLAGVRGFSTVPELTAQMYLSEGTTIRVSPDTTLFVEAAYRLRPLEGPGLWLSTADWGDYDGDGDPDLLLTGAASQRPPYEPALHLYRNNGDGTFARMDSGLPGVYSGAVAWGDYDNDGDLDLVITGALDPDTYLACLYRNDGGGSFAVVDAGFDGVAFGAVAWGDYDNDGDLDLVINGITNAGSFVTRVYRNDGGGSFMNVEAGLIGTAYGDVAWGDYDNDGDLDLVVSGGRLAPLLMRGTTRVYRNDAGRFNDIRTDIVGTVYGEVAWGDYDNDGDLDLVVLGATQAFQEHRLGRVYRNDGQQFIHSANIAGTFPGALTLGDNDGDDDLDMLLVGLSEQRAGVVNQYINEQRLINTEPAAPTALQAQVQGRGVTFSWNPAVDAQTPGEGLTYNLRVGTAPEASDVMPAMSSVRTGHRYLAAMGNVGHNTQWTLQGLPPGVYYWSVQAIDHSFKGSAFADAGSFTISARAEQAPGDVGTGEGNDLPLRYALYDNYPNPFRTTTTIPYDLPEPADAVVTIYNLLGQAVATLRSGRQEAGRWHVTWDGRDALGRPLGAGVYLVRLQAGTRTFTQKVLLVN